MDDTHQEPGVERPKRPNPLVDFLEHMTADEEASLRYLEQRDRETAGEPDPDALPAVPPEK